MVPVTSLLLPILVSAVAVFLASSIVHMLLPYHRSDFRRVPSEDDAMEALRRFNIAPGDYLMPAPGGTADMRSPEFIAKRGKGPVVMMTVFQPGPPGMGKQLALWFVYCLVVSLFTAYVTGVGLAPGAGATHPMGDARASLVGAAPRLPKPLRRSCRFLARRKPDLRGATEYRPIDDALSEQRRLGRVSQVLCRCYKMRNIRRSGTLMGFCLATYSVPSAE